MMSRAIHPFHSISKRPVQWKISSTKVYQQASTYLCCGSGLIPCLVCLPGMCVIVLTLVCIVLTGADWCSTIWTSIYVEERIYLQIKDPWNSSVIEDLCGQAFECCKDRRIDHETMIKLYLFIYTNNWHGSWFRLVRKLVCLFFVCHTSLQKTKGKPLVNKGKTLVTKVISSLGNIYHTVNRRWSFLSLGH